MAEKQKSPTSEEKKVKQEHLKSNQFFYFPRRFLYRAPFPRKVTPEDRKRLAPLHLVENENFALDQLLWWKCYHDSYFFNPDLKKLDLEKELANLAPYVESVTVKQPLPTPLRYEEKLIGAGGNQKLYDETIKEFYEKLEPPKRNLQYEQSFQPKKVLRKQSAKKVKASFVEVEFEEAPKKNMIFPRTRTLLRRPVADADEKVDEKKEKVDEKKDEEKDAAEENLVDRFAVRFDPARDSIQKEIFECIEESDALYKNTQVLMLKFYNTNMMEIMGRMKFHAESEDHPDEKLPPNDASTELLQAITESKHTVQNLKKAHKSKSQQSEITDSGGPIEWEKELFNVDKNFEYEPVTLTKTRSKKNSSVPSVLSFDDVLAKMPAHFISHESLGSCSVGDIQAFVKTLEHR